MTMDQRWTFMIAQSERGWDVKGHDDGGNSLPMTSYPNSARAIARLMQLMECPGPVCAQEHPEQVVISAEDDNEH